MTMLSYGVLALAAASLASAWPAIFYTDNNCTHIHSVWSNAPEGWCMNTYGAQSYSGSLESSDQELLLYSSKEECGVESPTAIIPGNAFSCIFVYKHIGPFCAAEVMPKPPHHGHKGPHKEPHKLNIQD